MGVKKAVRIIRELNDPKYHVDARTQRMRLNHCMNCEHYRKLTGQCKLCECFMALKTQLKSMDCELRSAEYPQGKWQKVA